MAEAPVSSEAQAPAAASSPASTATVDSAISSLLDSAKGSRADDPQAESPEGAPAPPAGDDDAKPDDKKPAEKSESERLRAAIRKEEKAKRIRTEATAKVADADARVAAAEAKVQASAKDTQIASRLTELVQANDPIALLEACGFDVEQALAGYVKRGTPEARVEKLERELRERDERAKAVEKQSREQREQAEHAARVHRDTATFTNHVQASASEHPNLAHVEQVNRARFERDAVWASNELTKMGHVPTKELLARELEIYYRAEYGRPPAAPAVQATAPNLSANPAVPRAQTQTLDSRTAAETSGARTPMTREERQAAAAKMLG